MKMFYHILAVIIVTIWGTTFVSTKVLLNYGMQPAEIFTIRFAIAYTIIALISPQKRMWCNNLKDELKIAAMGVTGGSLYFLTENIALEYAPASNVSLLVCTTPLITILLMRLVYGNERLSMRTITGSLLALAGVTMVVLNGHFVLELNPKGDLLAISASILWAIYTLLLYSVEKRYTNFLISRKVFGYGLLTIIPWHIIHPPQLSLETLSQSAVWGNILFLGIIASLICYTMWNVVVKNIGTTYSSNYLYINPIAATVAATLVLDERITIAIVAGAALILIGIAMARTKRSKSHS